MPVSWTDNIRLPRRRRKFALVGVDDSQPVRDSTSSHLMFTFASWSSTLGHAGTHLCSGVFAAGPRGPRPREPWGPLARELHELFVIVP